MTRPRRRDRHNWRWKRSTMLDAASMFYVENRSRGLDLEEEDDPPIDALAPPYAPPRPAMTLHRFGVLYVGEVDGVIVGMGLAHENQGADVDWGWIAGRRIPNDPRPAKYIIGEAAPPPEPGLRASINVDELVRKHRSRWTPDDEKRWAMYLRLRGPRVVLVTRFNRPLLNVRIEKAMGPPPRRPVVTDEERADVIERMRQATGHHRGGGRW